MIKIEINNKDSIDHYCFKCGTMNVGEKGVEKICDHFVYLGTSEGPEYDKLKLHNDDKSMVEIVEGLDNNHLGFYSSVPAPSGMESYVVYKLI